MDAWGVFGVVAAIVSFGVLVGAPLLKLNGTLMELKTVLYDLRIQVDKQCIDNDKEHLAIWNETEKHSDKLGDHETRITVLEHSKEAS